MEGFGGDVIRKTETLEALSSRKCEWEVGEKCGFD
jgi:hypothetical protein